MHQRRLRLIENARRVLAKSVQPLVEKKEEGIYELIRIYFVDDGIRHQNLADLVDLNRVSLRPYIKRLREKNLIKTNKSGKYESVENNFQDAVEKAYLRL